MYFIILSIICSVSVGVLLKMARNSGKSSYQIIAWNYIFALLALLLFFTPELKTNFSFTTGSIIAGLIILLPSIFILQAKAIQHSGIVKTDIAQRLSLFISIGFSVIIAKETFNNLKTIGLVVAFLAIFLTFYKKQTQLIEKEHNYFLPLVLIGFGVIDILFKKVATIGELSFTELLLVVFLGAFVLAALLAYWQIQSHKEVFSTTTIVWGAGVGLLNFGNIAFYIKAHQSLSSNPSTVFIGMNMGVIILGSLIGILYFKEKLTRLNYFGLVLSLVSIVLITISQVLVMKN
ncbi:EamA family transporter [Flavobacterium oreochromis]|uniref:Transporter n=1 Tax=Flavobacterium columnare TaxID=996 RepID=A0A246GAZ6_9FLAO|nr:EamA family transporter [Flavobacterium oreochromis]OWP77441.1 transporter [Flavobacterium oreochromis]